MVSRRIEKLTRLIRERSVELGFDLCGFAPSGILEKDGMIMKEWCSSGMNGTMEYLARDIDKRIDPGYLLPMPVCDCDGTHLQRAKQGGNDTDCRDSLRNDYTESLSYTRPDDGLHPESSPDISEGHLSIAPLIKKPGT